MLGKAQATERPEFSTKSAEGVTWHVSPKRSAEGTARRDFPKNVPSENSRYAWASGGEPAFFRCIVSGATVFLTIHALDQDDEGGQCSQRAGPG